MEIFSKNVRRVSRAESGPIGLISRWDTKESPNRQELRNLGAKNRFCACRSGPEDKEVQFCTTILYVLKWKNVKTDSEFDPWRRKSSPKIKAEPVNVRNRVCV